MNATIRRLTQEDVAAAEAAVRAFEDSSRPAGSLAMFLRNPANYLLVAEAEGQPLGFLLAYGLERPDRTAGQMFIYEIDVAASAQRQGVGSALMRFILDIARAEKMFEAFVLTSRDNEAARRLYATTGGQVEDAAAVCYVYPLGETGKAPAAPRS